MFIDSYFAQLIGKIVFKYEWLDVLAVFFASYFEYFLLAGLLLFLLKFRRYWKMVALAIISALVSRFVFAEIIRFLWPRTRPFVANNFVPLIGQNPSEASFPSGHAAFYFALSTIVFFYNRKAGVFFYVASVLITISRVYVGVHWLTDILAGAALGISIGWLGYRISNKLINKI